MIPLLTRAAVRRIDADAVERLGVPSLVLMENAGRGAAEALLARFADRLHRVVIVGGPGQNGGDGWVVARHLRNRGHDPVAVLVGDPARLKGDAALNWTVLEPMAVERHVVTADAMDALDVALDGASLVVDALFGTGLDRPIEGPFAEVVRRVNDARVPTVALDLPSGIDADTGQVLGVAVRAVLTPTFAAHKRGLHQYPGVDHAGEVVPVSIGVPAPIGASACLFEPEDVGATVGPRSGDAHKGSAGHVLVVAGSPGRTGAALLAGLGAARGGAGLATLAARGEARQALDQKVVELMTASLPDEAEGAVDRALELAGGMGAAVVGPGLGTDATARRLALALAQRLPIPAVLDADALTALADGGLDALPGAAGPRVLTPHPGEASRLLGRSTGDVQADRYGAALELAQRSGQVVVLKGARTVVAQPGGALWVCRRGTPALASGGTGDVLSGVVAAQLATLAPGAAAAVAVCLHAMAGELAARSDRGLLAREVADAVPRALEACRATAAQAR
jgi:ADP-dependent NAD(P)H-hydrate dehydratase / NAD(P)H-hydrate epimerase